MSWFPQKRKGVATQPATQHDDVDAGHRPKGRGDAEIVGDRRQRYRAPGDRAGRLVDGRARIEDDALSLLGEGCGIGADRLLLGESHLCGDVRGRFEGRAEARIEERSAMGALEIAAFGQEIEVAPDGREGDPY